MSRCARPSSVLPGSSFRSTCDRMHHHWLVLAYMRGYQGAFSSVPQPKQRLFAFCPVLQLAFVQSCIQSEEYSSFALLAQHPIFAKLKGHTQQRIRSQPSDTQCSVHLRPVVPSAARCVAPKLKHVSSSATVFAGSAVKSETVGQKCSPFKKSSLAWFTKTFL